MKKVLLIACAFISLSHAIAQSKVDISGSTPITWLGMDFTQLKFIGTATQWKDAGEITNDALRSKYFPGWNDLFINEESKYNVAEATHRSSVNYALEVTRDANNKNNSEHFSENPGDFNLVTEEKVREMVKKYDYKGKSGLGMMAIVDGMDKGRSETSLWVVFVDMGSKKVVAVKHYNEKAGGFGFRNFWAKSFVNMLKDVKEESWN
jgi:hypothetical protein